MRFIVVLCLSLLPLFVKSQDFIPVISLETDSNTYSNPIYDNGLIIFEKDTVTFKWYLGGEFWTTSKFEIIDFVYDFKHIIEKSVLVGDSIVMREFEYTSTNTLLFNKEYGYVVLDVLNKKSTKELTGLSYILWIDYKEQLDNFESTVFYWTPNTFTFLKRDKPRKKYLTK